MKLQDIRQANKEGLILAVKELCLKQNLLTVGEIHAISRTIMERWTRLGLDLKELNSLMRGES